MSKKRTGALVTPHQDEADEDGLFSPSVAVLSSPQETGAAHGYMGLDPGASGGAAVVYPDGTAEVLSFEHATLRDVWEWVCTAAVAGAGRPAVHHAYLEQVGGYVGKDQPGSAMFSFGAAFGRLEALLTAAAVPHSHITPRKWQAGVGVQPKGKNETRTQWKNRLKARAEQLFPKVRVTLAVADALLLAEFCRRVRGADR